MIDILLVPIEGTRTGRGALWEALARMDDARHAVRVRNGASHELARALVAAGVSDQPIRIRQAGLKGYLEVRSLDEHAKRTLVEGEDKPLHHERWRPPPEWGAVTRGKPENEGEWAPGPPYSAPAANPIKRRPRAPEDR